VTDGSIRLSLLNLRQVPLRGSIASNNESGFDERYTALTYGFLQSGHSRRRLVTLPRTAALADNLPTNSTERASVAPIKLSSRRQEPERQWVDSVEKVGRPVNCWLSWKTSVDGRASRGRVNWAAVKTNFSTRSTSTITSLASTCQEALITSSISVIYVSISRRSTARWGDHRLIRSS
jgi:hypothetical protein